MTNAVPLSVVNDKYMEQQYLFRAFSNLTELSCTLLLIC